MADSSEHGRDPLASVVLLSFSLVTLTISLFLYLRGRKRVNAHLPPGPRGLPLLGSLPFLDPDLHRWFAEQARTYGPVMWVRLGTKPCVILSSPAAAKEALKDQDSIFANHDPPAASSKDGKNMLWAPFGPHWRMLRKVCVRELLSPRSVEAVYPLRRREVRRAIDGVRAKAGKAVEVREVMFMAALDVMLSVLWGSTMEGEERWRVGSEIRDVMDGMVEVLGTPNVSDFFPVLAPLDLQGVGRRLKRLKVRFDQIFEAITCRAARVDHEAVGGGRSRDFLQVMLEIVERGDPQAPLTVEDIKALFTDLVAGGTDTTSTTVEWAMAELLRNPDTMIKAQDELEAVVGKNRIVEESDIPKLHYLDAVVKEVLRLHPVLPLLVPHRPSVSCTVGAYTIPKDTRVFINVWAIQRDPCIWKDPLEFKPERFLEATDKYDYSGNNFNYFPFGSGRRICVGILLAERMVMYTLASLLHSFEWRLPEGIKFGVSERFGMVLKKVEPQIAVPTERLDNQELYA